MEVFVPQEAATSKLESVNPHTFSMQRKFSLICIPLTGNTSTPAGHFGHAARVLLLHSCSLRKH